ncbi:MAG: helix-turn-helix transcriptional regulator [Clostridium celatum]|nr:helix-turn-helix transcriptional regulator [Clostridium celatum]
MNLKELINDSNLTMYGLAKKTGLGIATIHEICNGKRKDVNLSTGIKIANALNIPITKIQECIKGVEDES